MVLSYPHGVPNAYVQFFPRIHRKIIRAASPKRSALSIVLDQYFIFARLHNQPLFSTSEATPLLLILRQTPATTMKLNNLSSMIEGRVTTFRVCPASVD